MTRVTSDIERLQNFVTDGALGTIADLVMLIGIMSYMICHQSSIGNHYFCLLAFIIYFMVYVNKRLLNANRNIRDRQANLNAFLQENLSGMSTVQSFNRENLIKKDFDKSILNLGQPIMTKYVGFHFIFQLLKLGKLYLLL